MAVDDGCYSYVHTHEDLPRERNAGRWRTYARASPSNLYWCCMQGPFEAPRGTDDHILPLYNKKICNVIGVISFSYWLFQKCREYRRRDGARWRCGYCWQWFDLYSAKTTTIILQSILWNTSFIHFTSQSRQSNALRACRTPTMQLCSSFGRTLGLTRDGNHECWR